MFTNSGTVRHEAIFGDEAAQEAHADQMVDMGGMEMSGDSTMPVGTAGMDTADTDGDPLLEPDTAAEVTMTFDEPGSTIIGCHEPGHWEAGMRVDVTVVA